MIMSRGEPRKKQGRSGMSRRQLVHYGVAGGIALAVGGTAKRASVAEAQEATTPATAVPEFEFEEATIAELQGAMRSGKHTARSLAEAYLARIAALDGQGPTLRSVIEVNPDAMAIADALDAERHEKGARGPLHGIPVLIKDNVGTADRMETTAGSLALLGGRPPRDSFVAARLRAAGVLILGKTNLSEWANFRSEHSSSGWSARGGQCANPYALDRSPCGSSSGTGAAIAANLAAVGVGSETDGSIVCPSHVCSLVGIKPTVGLVSRSGIVPISHNQDTAGPMARTVGDAVVLLAALAGPDPNDPATAAGRGKVPPTYRAFLDAGALKGARIGVARKHYFGYSPETDAIIEEAIKEMARQGAVIVDPADIPRTEELDDPEMEVLLYDFKADINAYLAGLGPAAPCHNLADLIEFNEKHRAQEMPYFGQELFLQAQAKGPLSDKAYAKALRKCRKFSRKEGLDAVFHAQRLDAIVAPTGSPAWSIDLVDGDHFLGASSTPAAVSGYPSITVPAGTSFGLPVGLTFIGKPWGEGPLIRLAYAFEQATKVRRPPRFSPTAELSFAVPGS
jgi:amidase